MRTRHLIVTDVHGNIRALETALATIGFSEESDVLIGFGDRIDRGKWSRECLEVSARLKNTGRPPILLAGNHEALLIEALQADVASLDMWLGAGYGSRATLESYKFRPGRIDMAGSVLRVDHKPIRAAADVEAFLLEVFGERHLELIRRSERGPQGPFP